MNEKREMWVPASAMSNAGQSTNDWIRFPNPHPDMRRAFWKGASTINHTRDVTPGFGNQRTSRYGCCAKTVLQSSEHSVHGLTNHNGRTLPLPNVTTPSNQVETNEYTPSVGHHGKALSTTTTTTGKNEKQAQVRQETTGRQHKIRRRSCRKEGHAGCIILLNFARDWSVFGLLAYIYIYIYRSSRDTNYQSSSTN